MAESFVCVQQFSLKKNTILSWKLPIIAEFSAKMKLLMNSHDFLCLKFVPVCQKIATFYSQHSSAGFRELEAPQTQVWGAYNRGSGDGAPSWVQRQSSWSGGQGAKAPWSWNTFGFWTFAESCKFADFLKNLKRKKSNTICVVFSKKITSIGHNTSQIAMLVVDMEFSIHIHIHRRLTCMHPAPNFCKIQQCKSVYPPVKHDTDIAHFKLLKSK